MTLSTNGIGVADVEPIDPNRLTLGESTVPRYLAQATTLALTSGLMRFGFFTARKTETITQVRLPSGTVAAAATPTLIRIGIYSVDATTGALALIASTPNDTTLLAATFTQYTKALSASFVKLAGQRYAVAPLVVTATTAPQIAAGTFSTPSEAAVAPRLTGTLAAQSDLPSTATDASLAATGSMPYIALVP